MCQVAHKQASKYAHGYLPLPLLEYESDQISLFAYYTFDCVQLFVVLICLLVTCCLVLLLMYFSSFLLVRLFTLLVSLIVFIIITISVCFLVVYYLFACVPCATLPLHYSENNARSMRNDTCYKNRKIIYTARIVPLLTLFDVFTAVF